MKRGLGNTIKTWSLQDLKVETCIKGFSQPAIATTNSNIPNGNIISYIFAASLGEWNVHINLSNVVHRIILVFAEHHRMAWDGLAQTINLTHGNIWWSLNHVCYQKKKC